MHTDATFNELVKEAERAAFSGWDFAWLRGRMSTEGESWDFGRLVRARLKNVSSLLDMGTGGGEFLSSLAPLPPRTVATEGYPPNIEVARARLAPLGVEVVAIEGVPDNISQIEGGTYEVLPFPDEALDLVMNRHESFHALDVYRVLRPGGAFMTQQVGGDYLDGLNKLLGAPPPNRPPDAPDRVWNLAYAVRQLRSAGFTIADRREEEPTVVFTDIGAVVYYLKAVPWQIPDFTVQSYRDRLRAVHDRIVAGGPLRIPGPRFYVEARRP
jgi:SAM-dependent methyltransferase